MGDTTTRWRPQAGHEQGPWSTVAAAGGGTLGGGPSPEPGGLCLHNYRRHKGARRATARTGGEGPVQRRHQESLLPDLGVLKPRTAPRQRSLAMTS